jgi:DNA gyrase subunit A
MGLTAKNGREVVATFPVTDAHQVMLISNMGQMIRMPVSGVRFTGRAAQGVTLFKVGDGENVVSVAWLVDDEDDSDTLPEGEIVDSPDTGGDGADPSAAAH